MSKPGGDPSSGISSGEPLSSHRKFITTASRPAGRLNPTDKPHQRAGPRHDEVKRSIGRRILSEAVML